MRSLLRSFWVDGGKLFKILAWDTRTRSIDPLICADLLSCLAAYAGRFATRRRVDRDLPLLEKRLIRAEAKANRAPEQSQRLRNNQG